jgi:hypothetical protein
MSGRKWQHNVKADPLVLGPQELTRSLQLTVKILTKTHFVFSKPGLHPMLLYKLNVNTGPIGSSPGF